MRGFHVMPRQTPSVFMLLGRKYLSHCVINPIILKQTRQAGNIHWQKTARPDACQHSHPARVVKITVT
jgi:hypothetical protein